MIRGRRRRGALTIVLVLAVALAAAVPGTGPARAASLMLTDVEMKEAVRVGVESVGREAFDAEWRVPNAAGEAVVVITPFHRAVIAARHAAARNRDVKAAEIAKVVRDQRDRLVLWAELRGRRGDFARGLKPVLRIGDRAIKPAFVQNEHTARRRDGVYVARCLYTFPVKDVTGRSRVALVVRDAEGQEAHGFTIDLSAMR